MAKTYCTTGRVTNGQLFMRNKREMADALRDWKDGDVLITVERAHAHRSTHQNAYYWAVVIPRIQDAFKQKGIEAGGRPDVTNEVLKAQFMDPGLVSKGRIRGFLSDTGLLIGSHTSDLNKLEFLEYLERIAEHAAANWDCYIPPPDQNWREQAEREAAAEDPQFTMLREKGQAVA
jgi:hypothetical protein